MRVVLLWVSAGTVLTAAAARAEAEADAIVITALPPASGDAAYDIVTLGREQLTASASGRIEDVLGDVAGFQQYRRTDSRTANPTSQGATLRALGGNAASRALVTLDGAPLADPFAGYIPWFAIAPERLRDVRITRGAGAGAFGTGALAGTIELESGNPASLPTIRAELDYGSRNSLTASAIAAAGSRAGSIALFGRYDRGDGYVITPDDQRGPADIPARYAQGSFGLTARLPLGAETSLLVDALGFDDRRVRGLPGNHSVVQGVDTSLRLLGTGRWQWQALAYLQAQTFANALVTTDATRSVVTPSLDQFNTPATGVGGKVEVRPPLGRRLEVRFGLDIRDDSGRTEERSRYLAGSYTRLRTGGGDNRVAGGYAEISAQALPALTFTAGARLDRWRIGNGFLHEIATPALTPTIDERPAARSGWQPTGRAGLALAAADGVTLRAAAYSSYRLPTLNELYRPFRVGADAVASNSALGLEHLTGAEAGVDFRHGPASLQFTAFANRLGGAIGNVTEGSGPGVFPEVGFVAAGGAYRVRRNLDAVVARGVEATAHLATGEWRLDASYAYTHARVRASGAGAALDGLPPALTPEQAASATLGWIPRAQALVALTARYSGPQNEDDLGTRRLAGAATLAAVFEWPVAPGLVGTFRAENITDTLVEAGVSAAGVIDRGTPRTLTVGFRVSR